jgi:hypothetical protein
MFFSNFLKNKISKKIKFEKFFEKNIFEKWTQSNTAHDKISKRNMFQKFRNISKKDNV